MVCRTITSTVLTLTGMLSWFWRQGVISLGVKLWANVTVGRGATWGNQSFSIPSICNKLRRYRSLQAKKKQKTVKKEIAWMAALGRTTSSNVLLGFLTPFQASAEFPESSAVCPWRHSAGNWLNLPRGNARQDSVTAFAIDWNQWCERDFKGAVVILYISNSRQAKKTKKKTATKLKRGFKK